MSSTRINEAVCPIESWPNVDVCYNKIDTRWASEATALLGGNFENARVGIQDLTVLNGSIILDIPGGNVSFDDYIALVCLKQWHGAEKIEESGLQCLNSSEYCSASGQVLMGHDVAILKRELYSVKYTDTVHQDEGVMTIFFDLDLIRIRKGAKGTSRAPFFTARTSSANQPTLYRNGLTQYRDRRLPEYVLPNRI